ncbi:melatonin receptor type 1C-like [Stylophora pistillata]|uniref:melatonin receptor type 1C-like n=1 Tax=Stylophora pistillata TaxID=50429 RepID=UPI000C03D670|nr:melatonin receptor type 1C-like [Stylophora pistillata]
MVASLDEYPQLVTDLTQRSFPLKVLESTALIVLIALAFFGNVLICVALLRTPALRTVANMFVINLAVSDILMAVVCMPLTLCVLISGNWPFSVAVCDLQGFFMFSFGIVSQVNMSVVALNRYFAVCRPFDCKAIFTKGNVIWMIALLWILPSVASVPPLVGWGYYAFNGGKAFCIYPFNVNLIYTTIVQLLFIAFPLGLIGFSYAKCIMAIRANNRQIAQMEDNSRPSNQQSRKAREIRATWTMMLATLGFSLCWFPVSFIDFADTFTGGGNLPRGVFTLNGFLIFTSSSINPLIYWLTNRDFRKAYQNLLPCTKNNVVIVAEVSRTTQITLSQQPVDE